MQDSSSTCQTTITGIYTLQDYFVPDQTYVSHKTAKPSVLVMEASGSKQAEASGSKQADDHHSTCAEKFILVNNYLIMYHEIIFIFFILG